MLSFIDVHSSFSAIADYPCIAPLGSWLLAPGRIPPPAVAVALESEADDSDAEEIADYAATLTNLPNMDTLTCKCPIFCAGHITGTLKFVKIS